MYLIRWKSGVAQEDQAAEPDRTVYQIPAVKRTAGSDDSSVRIRPKMRPECGKGQLASRPALLTANVERHLFLALSNIPPEATPDMVAKVRDACALVRRARELGTAAALAELLVKDVVRTGRRTDWLCQCACGRETIKRADHVKRGLTRHCGDRIKHPPRHLKKQSTEHVNA